MARHAIAARYRCVARARAMGAEAFHFTRAIAPIGAYTRPLSIYHSEIVGRGAAAQCRSRVAPTGPDLMTGR